MGLGNTLQQRLRQRRTQIVVLGTALALGGCAYFALNQHGKDASGKAIAQEKTSESKEGKDGRRGGGGKRPPSVEAVTARAGRLDVTLSALGTVTASNTAVVKPRVDGQLVQVRFREGQWVKAGDVLAQIDPRPFQIQLDQAHGQLLRDQALLSGAKVELERYRELLGKDSIARQQVDTQEATVRQYEANVATSRAQEANARLQLDFSRVTAPAAGRLGLRQVDVGNMLRANDSTGLVTITQTRPIHVVFAIPANKLGALNTHLHQGESLSVQALDQDGRSTLAKGQLLSVDNLIDSGTGTVKLKAEFSNQDDRLFPNQFVNVRLTLASRGDGVLLPNAAVQRNGEESYVYAIDSKTHVVSSRTVNIADSDEEQTLVIHGLAAGEQVVLDGTDKLRPGSPVRVVSLDGKEVSDSPQGKGKGLGKHHKPQAKPELAARGDRPQS